MIVHSVQYSLKDCEPITALYLKVICIYSTRWGLGCLSKQCTAEAVFICLFCSNLLAHETDHLHTMLIPILESYQFPKLCQAEKMHRSEYIYIYI